MKATLLTVVYALVGYRKINSYPRDDKIVGGSLVTDIRTIPYVSNVYIIDPEIPFIEAIWEPYTVGTILSQLYVITACQNFVDFADDGGLVPLIKEYPLKNWQFAAGTTGSSEEERAQYRTPASIRYHPKCQLQPYYANDLAVAKMSEPFTFNDYVKPAKFFGFDKTSFEAHVEEIITSRGIDSRQQPPICAMSGWGSTEPISVEDHFGFDYGTDDYSLITPEVVITVFNRRTTEHPTSKTHSLLHTEYTRKNRFIRTAHEEIELLRTVGVYPMRDSECLIRMTDSLRKGLANDTDTKKKNAILGRDYSKILRNQICALSRFGNESACYGDPGTGLVCNGYLIGVFSWSIGCATTPQVIQSLPGALDWIKGEVCASQSSSDIQYRLPECQGRKDPISTEKFTIPGPEDEQSQHSAVREIIPQRLAQILPTVVAILQYKRK